MMVIKGKHNSAGELVVNYKEKYTLLSDDGEELVSAGSEDALFSALVMIDGEAIRNSIAVMTFINILTIRRNSKKEGRLMSLKIY